MENDEKEQNGIRFDLYIKKQGFSGYNKTPKILNTGKIQKTK